MSHGEDGIRRFPTGLEPLDEILGGGVPLYASVILAGEPGTGKTILAQQILFRNAAAGRKGLYLTTLSESPIKTARYQSGFSFFDPERFGESVTFMDIGETIRRQPLPQALEVIADSLRRHQADLVVVDSFKAIHDLAESPRDARIFAYDLAVELSAVQSTTLLVGEYEPEDIARMPEFAVADGVVWLALERSDLRTHRTLRVLKMRGIDNPPTPFSFEITRGGVSLFAALPVVPRAAGVGEMTSLGVSGLDQLLRGGVPRGSALLVSGEAGTGKTTLGLQYLAASAAKGERAVYFSYEQTPEQLLGTARGFGWDLAPLLRRGEVSLEFTPLPMVNPDKEVLRIRDVVKKAGAQRAVIDSLSVLMHGVEEPEVVRRHVYDVATCLANAGCTSLISTDPPASSGLISRFGVEESIVDGVIVLSMLKERQERRRYAEVLKMRCVNHACGQHLMRIGADGIRVFPRSDEAVR